MRPHILLGILAAAGGIWLGASLHGSEPPAKVVPGAPTQRAPSVSAAAAAMASGGATVAAPQHRLDMLALYNSGGSIRSLIYQALKRPDEGGYAYAMMMLAQCELPLEKHAPLLSAASGQALARLRARCDMTVQEKRQFETLFTDRRGHWKRDPLLKAIMSYGDAGTPGEQGDIATRRHSATPSCWRIASSASLRLCMERGLCDGSVEEALRAGSGKDFTAIESLASRVVQEFRRRNLAAFHPGA